MKKLLFAISAGFFALAGRKDTVTETVTYMINEPVFMSAKDFRNSVKVSTRAEAISDYGKMCFYEGYIYIAATGKGIHIIDNRNPKSPQNIGFIELLGNADLAIRNGKLYADALMDLVWFNISAPEKPELEGRLEDVFTTPTLYYNTPLPPTGNQYGIDYSGIDGSKGIIVGWELKQRTETHTYETGGWPWSSKESEMLATDAGPSASNGSSSVGVNGSMSRFTVYKDYLYSVINNYMSIIDLSGSKPKKAVENIPVGNVETIFSYKDNMFMGTPTGMVIYSVTDPLNPQYMSMITHVFGCDPVVVENDVAYVTVHSGNFCGQNANELIIMDVSDVKSPKNIVIYPMTNPKGLGIDNSMLFLCDDGLKIFDATNPLTMMAKENTLAHYRGMEGFDVIPFGNVLMMIAEDGLYQYDYSNPEKISLLSTLPIVRQ